MDQLLVWFILFQMIALTAVVIFIGGLWVVAQLSIDTQGTELAILKGAEKAINTTVVAVSIEVSFAPLYEGVPLFGELDNYLRSKGFILAGLDQFYGGYCKTPLQTRGKQIPTQGVLVLLVIQVFYQ